MNSAPSYGRFLRDVRQSRRLTQAQLAETTGIDQPNLSAYENDRRTPTIDALNRILVACGYQLVAESGDQRVRCPLPIAGWFADDDLPPALPGDPADNESRDRQSTSPEDRGRMIYELLQLADAQS